MTIPIKIIHKKEYDSQIKKKLNQEKIWDSIAKPWKRYVVNPLPIVFEFLEGKKGKIVDLGCGAGRNMIKNDNIEYFGVDFSAGQIKNAKKYVEKEKINAKLYKSDVSKLNKETFKNEMFDYGLFISTLHCIETEEKRMNALNEFYRILKKDAQGLISVWDSNDKRFSHIDKKEGDIYLSWKENGKIHMRFYHLYNKTDLLKLLEKTGFKVLEIYKPRKHDRFSKKNLIIRVKK